MLESFKLLYYTQRILFLLSPADVGPGHFAVQAGSRSFAEVGRG